MIIAIVILLLIVAGLFLYAAVKCEDQQGIFMFSVLSVIVLLVANSVGILGLLYKVGGM